MKVLHITSWYPSTQSPNTAIWIKRHIDALAEVGCTNIVYHIEMSKTSGGFSFKQKEFLGNKRFSLRNKFFPWFLLEVLAFFIVSYVLWKERKNKYDIINFHIAYPNLTYWHRLKNWIKTPVVITEHWSAYHLNFGLKNERKLPRIQRIFYHKIPLITVSEALKNDIRKFAGYQGFPTQIIPNIVDTGTFKYNETIQVSNHFFMLSQWKHPKDPFSMIEAFSKFSCSHKDFKLVIGGYGPQLDQMKELVDSLNITPIVRFLGVMNEQQIAEEMNRSRAFIHLSEYETFSVVCAEAICCGCPTIASRVGGIPEFVHENNGILLDSKEELVPAMEKILAWTTEKRRINAEKSRDKFSPAGVGKKYKRYLSTLIDHV